MDLETTLLVDGNEMGTEGEKVANRRGVRMGGAVSEFDLDPCPFTLEWSEGGWREGGWRVDGGWMECEAGDLSAEVEGGDGAAVCCVDVSGIGCEGGDGAGERLRDGDEAQGLGVVLVDLDPPTRPALSCPLPATGPYDGSDGGEEDSELLLGHAAGDEWDGVAHEPQGLEGGEETRAPPAHTRNPSFPHPHTTSAPSAPAIPIPDATN